MSLGIGSKLKKNRFSLPRCISGHREPDPQANRIRKRKERLPGRKSAKCMINDVVRLSDV